MKTTAQLSAVVFFLISHHIFNFKLFVIHIFIEEIVQLVNVEIGCDFTKGVDVNFKALEVFMDFGALLGSCSLCHFSW